ARVMLHCRGCPYVRSIRRCPEHPDRRPPGRAARGRGAARAGAAPVRPAAALPAGYVPLGVLVSRSVRGPGRREAARALRALGGSRRAIHPFDLDAPARGASAVCRYTSAVLAMCVVYAL